MVSDRIVVTPYDISFPKAAIWAVQMLEDVFNLVSSSLAIGFVLSAIFMASPTVSEHS